MMYVHRLNCWSKREQNVLLTSARKLGLQARRGGKEYFPETTSTMYVVEVYGDENVPGKLEGYCFGSSTLA